MIGSALSKVFDAINKIAALVVMLSYVLWAINSNWEFITNDALIKTLEYIMYYGPIAVCSLVMLEFGVKRNIIIQIVIYAIIAIVVVFQFFPGTFDAILGNASSSSSFFM